MACPAQYMLSASGCIFLGSSKPQASLVRGAAIGGVSGSRLFLLTCSASLSPSPSSPAPRCLRLLPRRRLRRRTPTATRRSAPRRRRYRLLPALAPLLSIPSEPSSLVAKGEGRGGQAAANENMRCAIHSCCAHAGRDRAGACGGRRRRGLAAGGVRARARAARGGVDSRRARASFFYF